MAETGDGAVWGMSWFLTWLSHTTPGLAESARLFDLFVASHPLMPLYVGAVAVQACSVAEPPFICHAITMMLHWTLARHCWWNRQLARWLSGFEGDDHETGRWRGACIPGEHAHP